MRYRTGRRLWLVLALAPLARSRTARCTVVVIGVCRTSMCTVEATRAHMARLGTDPGTDRAQSG